MKKFLSLILALAMVLALSACGGGSSGGGSGDSSSGGGSDSAGGASGGESKPVTISLAHIRPVGSSADIAINAFADEVTELTGGTVTFEIFPAAQLGDYPVVQERVSIGDVDMQIAPMGTSMDKGFALSNAPYLASNWEEAKEVFSPEGIVAQTVNQLLNKYGMTYLASYPLYFGGIALSVDAKDPTNPNAKSGIKIRVPSMAMFDSAATALGYLSTPLPSSEIFTAMQTGVVNGAIGMGAEGYYSNMADLVKYYLPINDHFEQWYLYINTEKFESLSAEQQEAMRTAALHMQEARWETAEAETAEYEQKLADGGTTVVEFTDEQLAEFAEVVRTAAWPVVAEDVGEEVWSQIEAALG